MFYNKRLSVSLVILVLLQYSIIHVLPASLLFIPVALYSTALTALSLIVLFYSLKSIIETTNRHVNDNSVMSTVNSFLKIIESTGWAFFRDLLCERPEDPIANVSISLGFLLLKSLISYIPSLRFSAMGLQLLTMSLVSAVAYNIDYVYNSRRMQLYLSTTTKQDYFQKLKLDIPGACRFAIKDGMEALERLSKDL